MKLDGSLDCAGAPGCAAAPEGLRVPDSSDASSRWGVPDWARGLDCSITVCDREGVIIYMNDKAVEQYRKHGNLIGKNLFACHGERSSDIIRSLLENGGSRCYTIEKQGVHKLIFQSAWTVDGKVAGLCEISIITPDAMPHYIRG